MNIIFGEKAAKKIKQLKAKSESKKIKASEDAELNKQRKQKEQESRNKPHKTLHEMRVEGNPWLNHLKKVKTENEGKYKTLAELITLAKKSYVPVKKEKKSVEPVVETKVEPVVECKENTQECPKIKKKRTTKDKVSE
jgi:hypothetical protein